MSALASTVKFIWGSFNKKSKTNEHSIQALWALLKCVRDHSEQDKTQESNLANTSKICHPYKESIALE